MPSGRAANSGIRPSSMKNVVIIACLLFGAFLIAVLCGADRAFSGRVGISAVFFFTALGHFAKPEEMMHMLPADLAKRHIRVSLGMSCHYFWARRGGRSQASPPFPCRALLVSGRDPSSSLEI